MGIHLLHEFVKLHRGRPPQLLARLSGIPQQVIHFAWTKVPWIDFDEFSPVQFRMAKGGLHKLLHRVRLSGCDDIIVRLLLLQHQPHGLHIVTRVAPIAFGIKVPKIQLLLQALLDSSDGSSDLSREFLYVNDLASACLFLMRNYDSPDPINVGVDEDISIADLATLIQRVVGCAAKIVYDTSKPDGTPRRKMDNSKLKALGWVPSVSLEEGIRKTYDWYAANRDLIRR